MSAVRVQELPQSINLACSTEVGVGEGVTGVSLAYDKKWHFTIPEGSISDW